MVLLLHDDAAAGEQAAAQRLVTVGDLDIDRDRARAGLRRRADAGDVAVEDALAEAFEEHRSGLADLETHDVGRRHLGRHLDTAGVEQSQDLAVHRQRFALVGDAFADHAVEGRAHLGVGQVPLGDLELRLGHGDHRCPVLGRGPRLVGGRLRDDVAPGQRLLVGAVARRPARIGTRRIERRLALVDLGLQLAGLEARQQLVLCDPIAFAHADLGQPAGDAGLDDGLVDRLGGAGEPHGVDQAARLDGVQFGRDQLERARSRDDGGGAV